MYKAKLFTIICNNQPVEIIISENGLTSLSSKGTYSLKTVIIIKSIFQSMRELLILGKILNFHNLFFDTKLHIFNHNNKLRPALKVKMSTPPSLRSYEK